ncbi:helix-turn-helix transcriptional regulator [Burkholderia sp. 3C]
MSASNTFASRAPLGLPLDGFSRWSDLRRFVPLSRETVRQRELEGRFPRASRLTQRCTVWSNREIHRWMADPLTYRSADLVCDATEGER